MKLDAPVCKIQATHTGSGWNRVSSKNFQGLEHTLYLAIGARVMFSNNTLHKLNINNGTTGTLKFIKFNDSDLNLDGSLKSPCLPEYVWVDFGEDYSGTTFFPNDPSRRGWVPVYPRTTRYWCTSTEEATRTMLPLKLAWGWTIHKSQGQTFIGKFVINLGKKEIAPGLTYVAISRAKSLENIGFAGGLPLDRVTTKLISARIHRRKIEEIRLRTLQEATILALNSTNP
jgi:ATP-dependent exoDNAse (exonuclease V) alpha subunit